LYQGIEMKPNEQGISKLMRELVASAELKLEQLQH
jgi:hypothetical protein